MNQSILTLVSAQAGTLTETALAPHLQVLKSCGVDSIQTPVWLSQGKAVDIIFDGGHPALIEELRQRIAPPQTDVFIQSCTGKRKKKLLVCDMDSTIVMGETLDDVAEEFGLKKEVATITAKGMRGEIDFETSIRSRVALLEGQPVKAFLKVSEHIEYNPGARTLIKTMNQHGAKCVLVTSGFEIFSEVVERELGFFDSFGNQLDIREEKLTGNIIEPLVDGVAKRKVLEEMCAMFNLSPKETIAVGDGSNDIQMIQAADIGVGYFGKDVVKQASPYQIQYTDLASLLYLQGYREEEFV